MEKYQPPKGHRVIVGSDASRRRQVIDDLIDKATAFGAVEIVLPTLDPAAIYDGKLSSDLRMYELTDRGGRELVLRPECTNAIASMEWESDTVLWYCQQCFRYDKPQRGRFREFTQFGVEWLNPVDYDAACLSLNALAQEMLHPLKWRGVMDAERGSGYYTREGIEYHIDSLGTASQVVGGGQYAGGFGFAIGVDRLVLAHQENT